jgi:hypothetical protein
MSWVRHPSVSARSTARSIATACASARAECRSSIATDSTAPIGFATSLPASVGAEPWTGSYKPGPSPMLAEGSIPSEPATAPASSDRMSPNRFSVRIALPDARHDAAPQLRGLQDVVLVNRGDAPPSPGREPERDVRDALDLGDGIAHRVVRLPIFELARLAEIQAAEQLTHDQQIRAGDAIWFERDDRVERWPRLRGTQVCVRIQPLAQREQAGFDPLIARQMIEARIANRAEQHGIARTARRQRRLRQCRLASAQRCAADWICSRLVGDMKTLFDRAQHGHGAVDHFRADAVTRQESETKGHPGNLSGIRLRR